jgi:hypothetical protein
MMQKPAAITEHDRRPSRTAQLALALVILVAIIYAVTFFKLPIWLPALR